MPDALDTTLLSLTCEILNTDWPVFERIPSVLFGESLEAVSLLRVADVKEDGPLDAYAPNPPTLGWEAGTTVKPKPGLPKTGWLNEG